MKYRNKEIRATGLVGLVCILFLFDISFVYAARLKSGLNLFKSLQAFLKSPIDDVITLPARYKTKIERFFTSSRTELALSINSQTEKVVLCAVNEKGEVLLPIAFPDVPGDFSKTLLKPREVRFSVDQYLNWVFESLPRNTLHQNLKVILADYLTAFYLRILEKMNYVRREDFAGNLVVVSQNRPYLVESFFFSHEERGKPLTFQMRILKPRINTSHIETRAVHEIEDEIAVAADTLRAMLDSNILSPRIISSPKPDKLHDLPKI